MDQGARRKREAKVQAATRYSRGSATDQPVVYQDGKVRTILLGKRPPIWLRGFSLETHYAFAGGALTNRYKG